MYIVNLDIPTIIKHSRNFQVIEGKIVPMNETNLIKIAHMVKNLLKQLAFDFAVKSSISLKSIDKTDKNQSYAYAQKFSKYLDDLKISNEIVKDSNGLSYVKVADNYVDFTSDGINIGNIQELPI